MFTLLPTGVNYLNIYLQSTPPIGFLYNVPEPRHPLCVACSLWPVLSFLRVSFNFFGPALCVWRPDLSFLSGLSFFVALLFVACNFLCVACVFTPCYAIYGSCFVVSCITLHSSYYHFIIKICQVLIHRAA